MPTIIAILVSLIIALTVSFFRTRKFRQKYAGVIDVDAELAKLRKTLAGYVPEKERCEKLRAEIALLEENIEDISFGIYKPRFKFDSSDEYKRALSTIRDLEKNMVRQGVAISFGVKWTVRGSAKEGQKMQKQYAKLLLRAFNAECDACVANVTWNNITKMQERIRKACESINSLGAVMQITIVGKYMDLKLDELSLEFETEQKKHEEVEEQRRIKEQMREEERALREAERARVEAEAEETRYEKALEKAKAEVARTTGAELVALNGKIQELQQQLEVARELKQRAVSLAQMTRSGHVYVISNIGSFGENVLKIGMTRRLEPTDRVRELGGASVPFEFDIHAMIYTMDAPTLEADFHNYFSARRLNLVNLRKEYFHVSLQEIEGFAKERGLTLQLTKLAEAREYRETLALRAKGQTPTSVPDSFGTTHSNQGQMPA